MRWTALALLSGCWTSHQDTALVHAPAVPTQPGEKPAAAGGAPALLDIRAPRDDVRVFLGATELTSIRVLADDTLQVSLPGSGLQRLRIEYRRSHTHDVIVGLGPGVKIQAMEVWGHRVVAQPDGRRCGAVTGHAGDWFMCDGHDTLPTGGVKFPLECPAPAAMADEHYFVMDPGNSDVIDSATFLPTLPGLYRATYASGKISLRYHSDDCED